MAGDSGAVLVLLVVVVFSTNGPRPFPAGTESRVGGVTCLPGFPAGMWSGRRPQTQNSGSRRDQFLPPSLAASARLLSTTRSSLLCLPHTDRMTDPAAPRFSWRRAITLGVFFGIGMGFFGALHDHRDNPVEGVIVGLASGAIFGTLMERWTRNQQHAWRQRTAALTEDLTPEERTTALKASRRGQLPVDPQTREAAAAITQYRLELMNRQATKSSLILGAFMVLYVLMAVFSSAWWWLGFLLFAFFLTMGWWQPRMLQHRLTLLAR